MRLFLPLMLLALAVAADAASYTLTSPTTTGQRKNDVLATASVTTTEDTLVFTLGSYSRTVQVVGDVAWGWSHATGAYGTKIPVAAGQAMTFDLSETRTIYVQAASGTVVLHPFLVK